MSYLPINEENLQAPAGQTTNAPAMPAPPQTSGSAGSAPEAPKGASSGSPAQFGSSASKLGAYLEANAPQITQQADTLAGNLNQQYGNVSQGITNAANQFGQQVQGGYAALNPDLVSQAIQDTTGFAANPENVQKFQSLYNDAYTGPLAFEGTTPYSDIQNQVSQAIQQGNLLGSESGLQSYLQGQGTNPNRASATLDALLLRGNPEAQTTIRNAAGQLGNLSGQLQTATTGANQSVLDAQKAAADAAAYTQNQINPYASQFRQGLIDQLNQSESSRGAYNEAATKAQTQAQDYRSKLLENQTKNIARAEEGIRGALPEQYYPFDKNPYYQQVEGFLNPQESLQGLQQYLQLSPVVNPANLANLSTVDQYKKDAALRQLIGQSYNPILDQAFIGQAGTAQQIPGMPGVVPTPDAAIQRMNDIGRMYAWEGYGYNPVQLSNLGGQSQLDALLQMTPQQMAQGQLTWAQQHPDKSTPADNPSKVNFYDAINRLAAG